MLYKGNETEVGNTFGISHKTNWSYLKGISRWSNNDLVVVGKSIIENAKQLLPEGIEEIDTLVLNLDRKQSGNRTKRNMTWATGIGSIAHQLECHMHAPPIVFLCATFFIDESSWNLEYYQECLKQIKQGVRSFDEEAKKLDKIEEIDKRLTRSGKFLPYVEERIRFFTRMTLGECPETYPKVLGRLLRMDRNLPDAPTFRIIHAIKTDNFARAYELIQEK